MALEPVPFTGGVLGKVKEYTPMIRPKAALSLNASARPAA